MIVFAALAQTPDCLDGIDLDGHEIIRSEKHTHLSRLDVFTIRLARCRLSQRVGIQYHFVRSQKEVAIVLIYFRTLMWPHRILNGDGMEVKHRRQQGELAVSR